jgi:hypothetical protein
LNYDIGAGWDRLWGISFEAGVPNKINLDYANAGETEQTYLEIDPTWTTSVGTTSFKTVAQSTATSSSGTCSTTGGAYQDTYTDKLQLYDSGCRDYMYEWDVSSITLPENAIQTGQSLSFSTTGGNLGSSNTCSIVQVTTQPSTLSGAGGATTAIAEVNSGTVLATGTCHESTNTFSFTALDMSNDWAGVGVTLGDISNTNVHGQIGAGTLGISYTIPPPYLPPAPSNLQTGAINSNAVNLEWTEMGGVTEELGLGQDLDTKFTSLTTHTQEKNLTKTQDQEQF